MRFKLWLASVCVLALGGCGWAGAGGGSGKGTVTVAIVANPQMRDIQKLESAFAREHPGVKVQFVTLPENEARAPAIAQDHCQTDPTFQTTRLYCRLTAAEVRRQLIERKGYSDEQLPSRQTIGVKLNALGFRLRKVAKCRPQKSTADRGHLRQRQGGA